MERSLTLHWCDDISNSFDDITPHGLVAKHAIHGTMYVCVHGLGLGNGVSV